MHNLARAALAAATTATAAFVRLALDPGEDGAQPHHPEQEHRHALRYRSVFASDGPSPNSSPSGEVR
ncbi:hypothetical protein [Phenylobacterium sp.]|uniref:hypothetical protein n=1 Tax=Phenylobacterium sp. TaxID=1871053 RepID=UPI00272FC4C5|nr:hypothetical protein [Phenylobacterium sp.]MDP1598590.1 hypothetical protein [Phenylobacterium sp.]MDP3592989.1 hypothetical protein [Phenylobacterium sp.]